MTIPFILAVLILISIGIPFLYSIGVSQEYEWLMLPLIILIGIQGYAISKQK